MIKQLFTFWRPLLPLALVLLAGAMTGCARVSVLSSVNANGSMQRTLTYHGSPPAAPGGAGAMAMPGTSLTDLVTVPKKAAGWTVTTSKDSGGKEQTVTATRVVAAGGAQTNDLGLKGAGGAAGSSKLLIGNTAVIRQTAPGTLEYRETLHWLGDPGEGFGKEPQPEALQSLRKALPASVASDTASLRKAALGMQKKLWTLLMGPGDPILPTMLFHQDYATYRMGQQLRGLVGQTLSDVYGARLSAGERKAAVDKLVDDVEKQAFSKTDSQKAMPGAGGASSNSSSPPPIPLFFRVHMPGKVTATNGQLDPETNDVVWPMYSSAPAEGDVVLTATCRVGR